MLSFILIVASLSHQLEAERAAERILQSQQASMMLQRAQHREIKQVQPISHLTPEEEASNRRAENARYLGSR